MPCTLGWLEYMNLNKKIHLPWSMILCILQQPTRKYFCYELFCDGLPITSVNIRNKLSALNGFIISNPLNDRPEEVTETHLRLQNYQTEHFQLCLSDLDTIKLAWNSATQSIYKDGPVFKTSNPSQPDNFGRHTIL